MANSADPDQLASSEANWSGSALFAKAKAGHVCPEKNLDQPVYLHSLIRLFAEFCLCSLKDPKQLQAGSEDSDQTSAVQVDLFAGCTCILVG